jgi:hypothetical protein
MQNPMNNGARRVRVHVSIWKLPSHPSLLRSLSLYICQVHAWMHLINFVVVRVEYTLSIISGDQIDEYPHPLNQAD